MRYSDEAITDDATRNYIRDATTTAAIMSMNRAHHHHYYTLLAGASAAETGHWYLTPAPAISSQHQAKRLLLDRA